LGVLAERHPETVALAVMPVLGRLTPAEWGFLARLAADHGRGELRLSPWRAVLIPGLATRPAGVLAGQLETAGFVVSADDPASKVVACIGSRGCPAAQTDALGDARTVIQTLRDRGQPVSVHLSGCEKRCAKRRPEEHELTFVGGPGRGQYRLFRGDGPPDPEPVPAGSLGPHLGP
jgi:precorrin-3B synthase